MTPTARPVRHTLYGTIAGAACGALLFLLQLPAGASPSDTTEPTPVVKEVVTDTLPEDTVVAVEYLTPPRLSSTPAPTVSVAPEEEVILAAAPSTDAPVEEESDTVEVVAWTVDPLPPTESDIDTAPPSPSEEADRWAGMISPPMPVQMAALADDRIGETDVAIDAATDPLDADPIELTVTVAPGDTLGKLLGEQDIPRASAHAVVEAMREVFDPRGIRPGYELTLMLRPSDGVNDGSDAAEDTAEADTKDAESAAPAVDLVGLHFEPSVGTVISLNREEDGSFKAEAQEADLVRQVVRHDGEIQSSLFEAGLDVGASHAALAELIRIYSFDVDFQRDIRKGDRFQMFYELFYTDDGRLARTGDILYASMTLSGTKYNLYRFEDTDGQIDFYNEKGEGVRKALLRTPINGARLSSGFGMRHHPVLGYSKMHKGVDFAAPRGTPIYAAGDGVIEKAGPFSSYGNYVRIRHNSEFKTAYAHMKGFAKGIKSGSRVKQGQVIGYVGTTGRSTGPHLHYEMLRGGGQVNPMKVRFPSGKTLKGTELAAFQDERSRIDLAFQNTPTVTKVARAD